VISCSPVQSSHHTSSRITDIQVVITIHIAVERIARGNIEQITLGAAYRLPTRHEAGACRRWRRDSFTLWRELVRLWKLKRAFPSGVRLMHARSRYESFCVRTGRLSRQPDASKGKAENEANKDKKSYVKVPSHSASKKSQTLITHSYCTSRKTGRIATPVICTSSLVTCALGADRICSDR